MTTVFYHPFVGGLPVAIERQRCLARYRRALEEECYLFNVGLRCRTNSAQAAHVCWEPANEANIVLLHPILRLYGCWTCGRMHECLKAVHHCPLVRGSDMSYVCAFSGAVLLPPDEVPGTFKAELIARSNVQYDEDAPMPATSYSSVRQLLSTANYTEPAAKRRRAFDIVDRARTMNKARRHAAALLGDGGDDDDDDAGGGGGGSPGLDVRIETHFHRSEMERDEQYQARFMLPLLSVVREHAHALRSSGSSGSSGSSSDPPSPPLPLAGPAPLLQNVTMNVAYTVWKTVHRVVEALERTATGIGMLPENTTPQEPPFHVRVELYAHLTMRFLEMTNVTTGHEENEYLQQEIQRVTLLLLLELFAEHMRCNDHAGNVVLLWCADPWLAACKRHHIAAYIVDPLFASATQHQQPEPTAAATVKRRNAELRTTVASFVSKSHDRKRKRASLRPSITPHRLPTKLANLLQLTWRNLSHQANALRAIVQSSPMTPQAQRAYLFGPAPRAWIK